MIMRELATKFAPLSTGLTRLPDRKTSMLDQNDADCFQRLASGESLTSCMKEDATTTDIATASSVGLNMLIVTLFGFQPALISNGNVNFDGSQSEIDLPDIAVGLAQMATKKAAFKMQNTSDIFDHKKSGMGQKSATHLHQSLNAQNPNTAPKVEQTLLPTLTVKQADILPNMASGLILPNVTQVQTVTSRISDLPHVTRVRIDHTKRNSSGVLTSLELVLEPAKLGRITAKIQHNEGRVTLVLSAEHSAIADDLARDSGLLLRVLGDQIPGLNKMAVFVQTEAQLSQMSQGQNFADLHSNSRQQKPRPNHLEEFERVPQGKPNDVLGLNNNATILHVRI